MATKYVWDKKTDEELQLWPSSSTERYMTRPFLPTGDINSRNRKTIVTSPQNLPVDSLARRGISAAALTSHKSGYYQSRSGAPFHLVIYTLVGSATLKLERKKSRYPKAAFCRPSRQPIRVLFGRIGVARILVPSDSVAFDRQGAGRERICSRLSEF